ncbi:hypothetical protein SCLCIDRAFT_776731 [Scleroderma citrinum Foug A]|uniref:Uncharacterized protein n=1 Tax=Scleroderma citrinum Foug A TaxID=1036808 RepID=A0A0C3AD08_9AGAM|nr:hypothetical protein SCLCIDRAFT_776731 [Scleroderma citrinum Foug A]
MPVWFHPFISESSANLNNSFYSSYIRGRHQRIITVGRMDKVADTHLPESRHEIHRPAPAHSATNGKKLVTASSHINVGKLPWHTCGPNDARGSNLSSLYLTSPYLRK